MNEEGNLPFLGINAPRFFNQDLGISKRTKISSISEAFDFELRPPLTEAVYERSNKKAN